MSFLYNSSYSSHYTIYSLDLQFFVVAVLCSVFILNSSKASFDEICAIRETRGTKTRIENPYRTSRIS